MKGRGKGEGGGVEGGRGRERKGTNVLLVGGRGDVCCVITLEASLLLQLVCALMT